MIDNGGYYWLGSAYGPAIYTYIWSPSRRFVMSNISSNNIGIRPVVEVDSTVSVIGGTGTMDDPDIITKNDN